MENRDGEPPPLLWELVRARVAPAEVDEVERCVGRALIERNADLRAEVEALVLIAGDLDARPAPLLADAGAARLLKDQIRMLAERVEDVEGLLSPRERLVLDEVVPLPPSPAGSAREAAEVEEAGAADPRALPVDAVLQDPAVLAGLNAFDIEGVAPRLRDALQTEHDALLAQTERLRGGLERSAAPPARTSELRSVSAKLERSFTATPRAAGLIPPLPLPAAEPLGSKGPALGRPRSRVRSIRDTVKSARDEEFLS